MFKHLFAAALVGACLVSSAVAQNKITWTEVTGSLEGTVGGIQMHGSAATKINGQWMLYAVGGNRLVGGDSVNVNYAPLSLNPVTVGTWTPTTFTFPTDGAGNAITSNYIERATFFYNGRLYIVGGSHNASNDPSLNKIRVFEPNSSGDFSAENAALGFDGAAAGVTPTLGTAGSSAVVDPATGYLYVVGGSADTSVRRFKIDQTTGAVSDYQVLSTTLAHAAYFSSGAVIKGGYIYVIDSHNTADRGKVQFAKINTDGTLGAFATTTNLPTIHIDGGSAVLNGEIYVVAGHTGPGNAAVSNKVHRSVTGSNGAITSWVEDAALPLTGGLRRVGVASLGDDGFVVVGGRNNAVFPPNVWVAKPVDTSVSDWSVY